MILAEKIIRLRKKNGWSQEELAERMKVSRQAVSKWESAQSVPDLDRILMMSQLFGVTTDYLLKDEMECEEYAPVQDEAVLRRVTMQEANAYLEQRKTASWQIALATFLCILSPIPLIMLGGVSEYEDAGISENLAGVVGLIALLVIVTAAVSIYILCGFRSAPYEFLEKEPFETEYGVEGMVREKQKAFRSHYVRNNILASGICILSPVPLLVGSFSQEPLFMVAALAVTLFLAGIGVMLFITAGVRWASMEKLLRQGEYSPARKKSGRLTEVVARVYWLAATALYLGISFTMNNWKTSWIVWPVAGVLYAAVAAVCNLLGQKEERP